MKLADLFTPDELIKALHRTAGYTNKESLSSHPYLEPYGVALRTVLNKEDFVMTMGLLEAIRICIESRQ